MEESFGKSMSTFVQRNPIVWKLLFWTPILALIVFGGQSCPWDLIVVLFLLSNWDLMGKGTINTHLHCGKKIASIEVLSFFQGGFWREVSRNCNLFHLWQHQREQPWIRAKHQIQEETNQKRFRVVKIILISNSILIYRDSPF